MEQEQSRSAAAMSVDASGGYVPGPTGPSYVATAAREYRGSGRARYLCRDVDPTTLQLSESGEVTHWTDYSGDSRYGDFATSFESSSLVTTERRAYAGTFAERTHDVPAVTRLLHGDLVGSTGWLTDVAGQVTERLTYTAFGEPVTQDGVGYPPAAIDTRYGYGGAWGYETGLLDLAGADANLPPVRLLHVGYRWYQPDIGRFVQRDPIGIAGGLNVYLYCGANPVTGADPLGLWRWWFQEDSGLSDWVARNVWMRIHDTDTLANMSDARVKAEAIGASVAIGAGGYAAGKYIVIHCIRAAGYGVRFKVHDAHHTFGHLGKLPHLQWNWWQLGIPGSGAGNVFRVPLPPGFEVLGWTLF